MERIEDPENPDKAPRKKRGPRKVSPDYLKKAALHYLEQRATSTAMLRTSLMRKVARSVEVHGTDAEEATGWVEALLVRLTELGLLNDDAFSEMRAASLNRQGKGSRYIRGALARQGLGDNQVDQALESLKDDHPDPDLAAAQKLARRRGLGPYRADPDQRRDRFERDMASLARAGFDYATVRRVLDAETAEELEDLIEADLNPE
ncbi:MAG: regulatory protein RecX [Rhodospirillales bacterium]